MTGDVLQLPALEVTQAPGLAVYLFAPLAIIVPLTVSSAVGANTVIGERERGSGEFLAHSPAGEREIYVGKLIASLVPGYAQQPSVQASCEVPAFRAR